MVFSGKNKEKQGFIQGNLVGLFKLLFESIIVNAQSPLSAAELFKKATTMGTRMTRIKQIYTDLFVRKLRSA